MKDLYAVVCAGSKLYSLKQSGLMLIMTISAWYFKVLYIIQSVLKSSKSIMICM